MIDLIISNAKEILTLAGSSKPHSGEAMMDLGILRDASIAVHNGMIIDIAPTEIIKNKYCADKNIDASAKTLMPGFVDPHTHPVFLHTRENEFAMRLAGKTYVEISKAGGGIRSTLKSTRDADPDLLFDLASDRIKKMMQLGTTTLEAKSGYGLSTDSELKQLQIISRLNGSLPIDIVPTFMGAHEYPEEYSNNHSAYIKILTEDMIPKVAEQGLAKYCDIFCEAHVYNLEETRRVLSVAKQYGLSLKMHADEIEPMGGAGLAADLGCISADHLGAASDDGLLAMKDKGVIAVLLPATLFSLRSKSYARARFMIEHDLPVAIATDFNPGSCNCDSMQMVISLACLQMNMMPQEAITAATINAAFAIGMQDKVGSLEIGKKADILIWDIPSYNFLPYHIGSSYLSQVLKEGNTIYSGA